MGINFLKKAAIDAGKIAPEDVKEEDAPKKLGLSSLKSGFKSTTTLSTPKKEADAPASNSGGGTKNFLKTGKHAKQLMDQDDAQHAAQKEKAGQLFEFRMKGGEERKITFLDGDLQDDGTLDIPAYYEHNIKVAGIFETFVCTSEEDPSQPCPLCAMGDKRYLAGLLTILDHSEYVIKNGPKAGQTVKHQKKLFKCKHATIKILTKWANKHGGLRLWTYDVSRSGGDKSPAVGDTFMSDCQWSLDELATQIGLKVEELAPADYSKEVIYKSPEQLLELGIGKSFTGVGTKQGGSVNTGSLKSQL